MCDHLQADRAVEAGLAHRLDVLLDTPDNEETNIQDNGEEENEKEVEEEKEEEHARKRRATHSRLRRTVRHIPQVRADTEIRLHHLQDELSDLSRRLTYHNNFARSLIEAEAELESIRERMLSLEKERKEARLAEDSLQAEVWEAFKRSAEAARTFELALCGL